jgi:hypothetical protein
MENQEGSSQLIALRGPQGEADSSQDSQNISPETNNSSQASSKPAEIITVPIADLAVPSWNPRKFMDEAKMQNLVAYLEKGGLVPRPWVWRGNGQAPYSIISGQRRLEAHRRLGKSQLEVEILDVSLAQAKILAISSNQDEEMHWWDWCKAIGGALKDHSGNQRDLAAILGVNQATVSRSKQLLDLLNPTSQAQLDALRIKIDSSYTPSYRVVNSLTGLGTLVWPPDRLQAMVERTLKVVIDQKMTESQAKKLVEWVKAGNSPESYSDSVKSVKVKKLEGGDSHAIADGSVDDGVAGFEKLVGVGIPEDQQQEEKTEKPEIATSPYVETSGDRSQSPLSAGQSPETLVQGEASAKADRNDGNLNDPYSSYWQKLPPNVTVTRTAKGYEIHAVVAPNEAVPAAYGLLANLEHLKGLTNETQDLQFRNALPQVMEESRKTRLAEKATGGESVEATPEKVESGENTSEIQKPTLIETVKTMVKDKMKTAPADVTDALLKDGKQALNYQIRKGMRGILKDWL